MTRAFSRQPLRVLLTEGASTSAREAVTALGLSGHHIEVCDPDAHCLCRFSTFVRRVHRCPGIGEDPQGYLDFVLGLLGSGSFDVLLPIHEQGLLFSKVQDRLPAGLGLALPSFGDYSRALDKASFARLLTEIGVGQPETRIVERVPDGQAELAFPFVLKRSMSTASRDVWMVRNEDDLRRARHEIGKVTGELIQQKLLDGPLEHAQALFDRGRFVAMHGYRQLVAGAGGGEALKESVWRPRVRNDIEKIARELNWHGALSLDYIMREDTPCFIDSNPRLVEPMSARLAGSDLADILLRISIGEHVPETPPGKMGLRTHIAMQGLLGAALKTGSRIDVMREARQLMTRSGRYSGSQEELTPVTIDWLSFLPLAFMALVVIVNPGAAKVLPQRGWGAGLLTPESIRKIRDEIR